MRTVNELFEYATSRERVQLSNTEWDRHNDKPYWQEVYGLTYTQTIELETLADDIITCIDIDVSNIQENWGNDDLENNTQKLIEKYVDIFDHYIQN